MLDIATKHAKLVLPGFLALLEGQLHIRYHVTGDEIISPEQGDELKEFDECSILCWYQGEWVESYWIARVRSEIQRRGK